MSTFRGANPAKPAFGKPGVVVPKPINWDAMSPVFCLALMKEGNGYSVDCCDLPHRAALAVRLSKLSQMTWLQIKSAPRHGLGCETIARNAIKSPLPQQVTDDVVLIALRYNGKSPMVGYRDERTFHILFIDHNMTLYKH